MQSSRQCLCLTHSVTIHQLHKNSKKKLDQGNCQIYKQNSQCFVRLVNFVINLKNISFAKIVYKHSITYFYSEDLNKDNVLALSISTEKNSQKQVKQFQAYLRNYSQVIQLRNWQNDSNLIKKLQHAWPQYQSKCVQSNGSKITKISKQIGGFMGAISGLVTKPLSTASKTADNARQSLYQSQIKDQTKNKWQKVKQKAGKLNQSLSEVMKPINTKAKDITSSIGHSFNHSENTIIKAIRDFGITTKNALNQGYNEGMGEKKAQNQQLEQETDVNVNVDVKK